MTIPNSYNDPIWAEITKKVENELSLPKGLLHSIVVNGEKSNNDQVSSVGAKSPFQITPTTAKLIEKKYGFDPMEDAASMALAGGLVLKEGVDKYKDQPDQNRKAAQYYFAGGNPKNQGPKSEAYADRVNSGLDTKVNGISPEEYNKLHAAYMNDELSPDDKATYESIFKKKEAVAKPKAQEQPSISAKDKSEITRRYVNHELTQEEMGSYDRLFGKPEAPKEQSPKEDQGFLAQGLDFAKNLPGQIKEQVTGAERETPLTRKLPDYWNMPEFNLPQDLGGINKNALGTATSTKEMAEIIKEGAPDVKLDFDAKGNPIFTSSIDKKRYAIKPGLQFSDLPRVGPQIQNQAMGFVGGGKIAQGFGKAAGGLLANSLGGAISGIESEAQQARSGGTFDPTTPMANAVLGPAGDIAGRVGQKAIASPLAQKVMQPISNVASPILNAIQNKAAAVAKPVQNFLAKPAPEATFAPDASYFAEAMNKPGASSPISMFIQPKLGEAPKKPLTGINETIKRAMNGEILSPRELAHLSVAAVSKNDKRAIKALAEQAKVNPEMQKVFAQVGAGENLPADYYSDNKNFQRFTSEIRNTAASTSKGKVRDSVKDIKLATNSFFDSIGADENLGAVSNHVREVYDSSNAKLKEIYAPLYNEINSTKLPGGKLVKDQPVSANLSLQHAHDMKETPSLRAFAQEIEDAVAPKEIGKEAVMGIKPVYKPGKSGPEKTGERVAKIGEQPLYEYPTYQAVDDSRKQILNSGFSGQGGVFTSYPEKVKKEQYFARSQDLKNSLRGMDPEDTHGLVSKLETANAAATQRFDNIDKMKTLFGKDLKNSMVDVMKSLPNLGSKTKFQEMSAIINAIPPEARPLVVKSAFREAVTGANDSALGVRAINFEKFSQNMKNLKRSPEAYAIVMKSLGPEGRRQVEALYKASLNIQDIAKSQPATGAALDIRNTLKDSDLSISRLYSLGRVFANAGAKKASALANIFGLFKSLIRKNADETLGAIDELIASPAFARMSVDMQKPTSKKKVLDQIARSDQMSKFTKKIFDLQNVPPEKRQVITEALTRYIFTQSANTETGK